MWWNVRGDLSELRRLTSYFFLCLSEVKLSLASFLSDRIVDEILEALSSSQLTLVRHESAKL